jgi:hypothetical protein
MRFIGLDVVGFVNSAVADFQGNPEPVASGVSARQLAWGGQKERLERARERFASDSRCPVGGRGPRGLAPLPVRCRLLGRAALANPQTLALENLRHLRGEGEAAVANVTPAIRSASHPPGSCATPLQIHTTEFTNPTGGSRIHAFLSALLGRP